MVTAPSESSTTTGANIAYHGNDAGQRAEDDKPREANTGSNKKHPKNKDASKTQQSQQSQAAGATGQARNTSGVGQSGTSGASSGREQTTQGGSNSQFEPQLPLPSQGSSPSVGKSALFRALTIIGAMIKDLMEARADRAEHAKAIATKMVGIAQKENEELRSSLKKAEESKKAGWIGKILSVVAVALAGLALLATVATGGAAAPIALAAIGLAVSSLGMIDMLANDGKATQKVMEKTLQPVVKALADAFKEMGLGEQAAQVLAMVVLAVVMLVASMLAGSSTVTSGVSNMIGKIPGMMKLSAQLAKVQSSVGRLAQHGSTAVRQAAKELQTTIAKFRSTFQSAGNTGANVGKQSATTAGQQAASATGSSNAANAANVTSTSRSTATTAQQGANQADGATDVVVESAKKRDAFRHALEGKIKAVEVLSQSSIGFAQAGLQIYQAKLDKLTADDQADLKRLEALLKLLQFTLEILGDRDKSSEALSRAATNVLDSLHQAVPSAFGPIMKKV